MKTLVLAALLVTSTAFAEVKEAPAKIHEAGKKYLAEHLLDPESARFESAAIENKQGGYSVCGVVRARNSFGGYAKPRYFFVVLDKKGKALDYGVEPVFTTQTADEMDNARKFYSKMDNACFKGLQ